MSFPDAFLDEIRARVSLAEVIGRQVRLVRKGREHSGLCPFHSEKTPSFTVNEAKGFYHCFGCGAHGSLFDFVMQTQKLGFREAVEQLAGIAGMSLPADSPEAQARERQRRSLLDALAAATAFYQQALRQPEGSAAREYLSAPRPSGRGVSEAAIASFRLGFAPAGRTTLKAALGRDGFDEDVLLAAGLVIRPDDPAQAAYDRFRGRVMFPIGDARGRVVGFGGRVLGPGEPKYLNSPETALFQKGRLLYGFDRAAEPARETGRIVVVEGYMDVIGLVEAGLPAVVAPLGTALGDEQLRLLWTVAAEPVLLFDPDAAGERAALRAAERALPLLQPGQGLRFAMLRLDTRDDPDDVAKRYPRQALQRTLAEAAPLSDFLYRAEVRGRPLEGAEARAAAERRLRERAQTIADASVRAHMLSVWRERLWRHGRGPSRPRRPSGRAGEGTAGEGMARSAGLSAGVPAAAFAAASAGQESTRRRAERNLLALIIRHPQLFTLVEEELGSMPFDDATHDRLRQTIIARLSSAPAAAGDAPDADHGDHEPPLEMHLREAGFAAELDAMLAEPWIASTAELPLTRWQSEIAVLRRLQARDELSSLGRPVEISSQSWELRRALIDAGREPDDR